MPMHPVVMHQSSSTFSLSISFRMMNPAIPETREAMSIAIFEILIKTGSVKARSVMKMDIVNPIPPSNPAPSITLHFKPCGSSERPAATAMNENRRIPRGLPATSPAIMPGEGAAANPEIPPSSGMAVFASAKSGRIMNATGICNPCATCTMVILPLHH